MTFNFNVMKKIILFTFFITILSFLQAQNSVANVNVETVKLNNGFYQKYQYDSSSECNCSEKTERDFKLAERLLKNDILDYNIISYNIDLGKNLNAIQKLFYAIKQDSTIIKLSIIEWSKLSIVFTDGFDENSFFNAATQVFAKIEKSNVSEFLWQKNKELKLAYEDKIRNLQSVNK